MKRPIRDLVHAREGAAALEFVLAAPFLILLLVGILQVGVMFLAQAGLQQAVEAGARYATIYPRPSDGAITTKIVANEYGMHASGISNPVFAHGTTAGGSPYVDISMTYSLTPDFIFFQLAPIQLQHTRRAYQVAS